MRHLIDAARRLVTPAALRLAEDKRRLEALCRKFGLSRTVARQVVAEYVAACPGIRRAAAH